MMSRAVIAVLFFALSPFVANAQEGRQIRLDANTCKNIVPEYVRKKNNPLYAKAILAEKSGHANDMQKQRLREVRFLQDTVKVAKCKGIQ